MKAECGEWAVAQGPTLCGVWGGTTARQRQLARTVKVLDPWPAEDGPGLELVGAYLADRCVVDPDRTTLRVDLYRAFSAHENSDARRFCPPGRLNWGR